MPEEVRSDKTKKKIRDSVLETMSKPEVREKVRQNTIIGRHNSMINKFVDFICTTVDVKDFEIIKFSAGNPLIASVGMLDEDDQVYASVGLSSSNDQVISAVFEDGSRAKLTLGRRWMHKPNMARAAKSVLKFMQDVENKRK